MTRKQAKTIIERDGIYDPRPLGWSIELLIGGQLTRLSQGERTAEAATQLAIRRLLAYLKIHPDREKEVGE